MSAMQATNQLPPAAVRVSSWLFLVFLLMPILVFFDEGTVGMLGMQFASGTFFWLLAALLFASGVTALAILRRWRWAYDCGIAYATACLFVGLVGFSYGLGSVHENEENALLQLLCVAWFLRHLVRHRGTWRTETANA